MIKNYFIITLRNMARHKLFAIINVLGLSVSIACSLLLFVFVSEQLNFDHHHEGKVFRINSHIKQNTGDELLIASSSFPISPAIQEGVEGVEYSGRVLNTSIFGGKDIVKYQDEIHSVTDGAIADSTIFQILKYDIIEGSVSQPFKNSKSIVLEKGFAQKLFGGESALGKILQISTRMGQNDYEVSGIYDKNTFATHYAPSFFMAFHNEDWRPMIDYFSTQWVGNNLTYSYVKIADDKSEAEVLESIMDLFISNASEEMKVSGIDKYMTLIPVEDIHTNVEIQSIGIANIDPTFLYVLFGIAILILLLACVNYINLSTAQSGTRALEVGVKKVMGVTSKGLIRQFLGESFLIVFISICFSILIAEVSLPFFNSFIDYPISFHSGNIVQVTLYLLGFLVVTALIAGLYPSIYLASFKPATVLKGKNKDKGSVTALRKFLVTFQFVISIVLISSILIISEQVDFLFNKDLGFDSSSRIVVPLSSNEASKNYDVLKKQFAMVSSVDQVSAADFIPGMIITNDILIHKEGETVDESIYILNNDVDYDFFKVLNIEMASGREFIPADHLDTLLNRVIINRAAVNDLQLTAEEAVGELLYFEWRGSVHKYQVIGVADNINQSSLHQDIQPMMFTAGKRGFEYMIVETTVEDYTQVKGELSKKWAEVMPDEPFEPFTLDSHLQNQYEGDLNTMGLIKFFAIVSVIISCMGLYALSMFVAERKFKEIGVRKALGANASNILLLVSKELSLLVIVSFLVAVPLSYYAMGKWLDTFAFKITPSLGTFLIAGIISIGIAWLTISYQSFRAARTNPVDSLRAE